MRVLVVYGGGSAEREVSLRSGKGVGEALIAAGHEVAYFDPGDDTTFMLLGGMVLDKDVVFPILHGKGGEDGLIQAVLEQLGMPYVGSSSVVSKNCFDKVSTLQALHNANIVAPVTDLIAFDKLRKHPLTKKPFVLKPREEGSSVATFLVRDLKSFKADDVRPAFDAYGSMLIEELIEGIELTVAVLGPTPLPVIEIVPPPNKEFDYENKYNGATQELCPPQHIPEATQKEVQDITAKVHTLMGCRDLSRTDFIWGKDGKLYCLEINTLPGMTNQSLFPKAAAAAGIPMPQLVDSLVNMAAARAKTTTTL